jgi:hypothetical protein
MYLAKPLANPCGNSNFALYMAVHDTEQRGVLVKIPGCIELDEKTGQITTSFDELPQFPFSDFTLSFRSGQRAPLVTPPQCGTQTIGVKIASYARPNDPVDRSKSFCDRRGAGRRALPGLTRPAALRSQACRGHDQLCRRQLRPVRVAPHPL